MSLCLDPRSLHISIHLGRRATASKRQRYYRESMPKEVAPGLVLAGPENWGCCKSQDAVSCCNSQHAFSHRTNITEQITKFSSSRGHLVSSFLASQLSHPLEEDITRLIPCDAKYAGFNMLLLAPSASDQAWLSFDATYVTNGGAGGPITHRPLTDAERHRGGLSNGIEGKGADEWPKLQHGLVSLQNILGTLPPNTSEDQLAEQLFELLTWVLVVILWPRSDSLTSRPHFSFFACRWRSAELPRDRSELKNTIQVEPVTINANTIYATRLSTVVLVKRNGEVVFVERDRWKLTEEGQPILADPSSQRVFRFKLNSDELSS
jgi:uncharacterized protein with NRDE domain